MYSFYLTLFEIIKIVETLEPMPDAEPFSSQTLQELACDQNLPIKLTE